MCLQITLFGGVGNDKDKIFYLFIYLLNQLKLLNNNMQRSTKVFLLFAIGWQIAVGIIYGLFIRVSQGGFYSMVTNSGSNYYTYTDDAGSFTAVNNHSVQVPFPQAVVVFAIVLLIVGLALVAAYIERASVSSMAYTLLIFALTTQNFFIFRDFWNRIGVNDPNASTTFNYQYYQQVNYINYGNSYQFQSGNPYAYNSASFLEAIGASLALYAGFTAVIGRIGLGEIFFLSWIGTFIYEVNSQVLWRLYIPDNGFASRAFGFGGALGIVSSLILGKRQLTSNNINFLNTYYIRTLSFLGVVLVCCSYPILVLSNVYDSAAGEIVAMSGQVNIWIALAGSIIGCYIASTFIYRKFCVHDMVLASFSGAIAFSSSTDVNYNPGAALAIGTATGFICALGQIKLKRAMNREGVIDSNGTLFQFLVPSALAAIFSAILQGVGQSATTFTGYIGSSTVTATASYVANKLASRSETNQGGFQIAGWCISIGFGAATGAIIGLIYKALDERSIPDHFFSDLYQYDQPKLNYGAPKQPSPSNIAKDTQPNPTSPAHLADPAHSGQPSNPAHPANVAG